MKKKEKERKGSIVLSTSFVTGFCFGMAWKKKMLMGNERRGTGRHYPLTPRQSWEGLPRAKVSRKRRTIGGDNVISANGK